MRNVRHPHLHRCFAGRYRFGGNDIGRRGAVATPIRWVASSKAALTHLQAILRDATAAHSRSAVYSAVQVLPPSVDRSIAGPRTCHRMFGSGLATRTAGAAVRAAASVGTERPRSAGGDAALSPGEASARASAVPSRRRSSTLPESASRASSRRTLPLGLQSIGTDPRSGRRRRDRRRDAA